jgi:hypothetical protein
MESIVRHVRDIDPTERRALEHVIGQQLREDQQVIIQVVTLSNAPEGASEEGTTQPPGMLPDWCNVFEGLSGEQFADLEATILQRSELTRPSS